MKILFVAPHSEANDQIEVALRKTSHHILTLSERAAPFWRIIRRVPLLRRWNNNIFNERICAIVAREKPDFVFTVKGTSIQSATLNFLRSRGIKTANWFPENVQHPGYKKWFERYAPEYDYFFTFDPSAGYWYLPFGINPEVFSDALEDSSYRCDVIFIGAPYPERVHALEIIHAMGVDLKIFGWDGWSTTPLARLYHGPLNARASATAYRSARISLNMNLEPAVTGVNIRTFEILASGGFELSDYRSDLEKLFDIGSEIAVFRTIAELPERISYYLEHTHERDVIARRGHNRVLKDHTIDRRIAHMLSIIQS